MSAKLETVVGDITTAIGKPGELRSYIVHCCNDGNAMGSGVAFALSKKWHEVKGAYHAWFNEYTDDYVSKESASYPVLGETQIVLVQPSTFVVNLIGQKGVGVKDYAGKKLAPVRYGALTEGLLHLRKHLVLAFEKHPTIPIEVNFPLMGAGLAAGDWNQVAPCIMYALGDLDITLRLWVLTEEEIPNTPPFNRGTLV